MSFDAELLEKELGTAIRNINRDEEPVLLEWCKKELVEKCGEISKKVKFMEKFIKYFKEITLTDLPNVGGKNPSLGEMFQKLSGKGIAVPDGFALTADAYWKFIEHNNLWDRLSIFLSSLDTINFSNLSSIGTELPQAMKQEN